MVDVNWQEPIEAVREDGRVVAASLRSGPDADGDYKVDFDGMHGLYVMQSGKAHGIPWTIRNTRPTHKTALECLDAMEAGRTLATQGGR